MGNGTSLSSALGQYALSGGSENVEQSKSSLACGDGQYCSVFEHVSAFSLSGRYGRPRPKDIRRSQRGHHFNNVDVKLVLVDHFISNVASYVGDNRKNVRTQ